MTKKPHTKQYYQKALEDLEYGHPYEGELEDIFIHQLSPETTYHKDEQKIIGEYDSEFHSSVSFETIVPPSSGDINDILSGKYRVKHPPKIEEIQKILQSLAIVDYFIVLHNYEDEYEVFFKNKADAIRFKLVLP